MMSPRLKRAVEQAYERPVEQQEVYAELLEQMLAQTAQAALTSEEFKAMVAASMEKHADTLAFLKDK